MNARVPRLGLWTQRVGWLILIWLASVLALAALAGVFRVLMGWAGLTR